MIAAQEDDMTEDQIERRVEMIMDSLDARLMSGSLSQSEYDQEVKRLNDWAEEQYRILSREVAL